MFEDDTDTDEEAWLYNELLSDPTMQRIRRLFIDGSVFRHEKHQSEVHPGVQHKLGTWSCETRRPSQQCPCGLYSLRWLDAPKDNDGNEHQRI